MIRKISLIVTLLFVQTTSASHSVEAHEHDGHECDIYLNVLQTEYDVSSHATKIEKAIYCPFSISLKNFGGLLSEHNFFEIRAPPYLF